MDTFIQELVEKNKGCDVKKLILEEKSTRKRRIREAFLRASVPYEEKTEKGFEFLTYYAMLALGEDLKTANEKIYQMLTTRDEDVIARNTLRDKWSLWINPLYIRMYMYFGTPGTRALSEENERLILKLLWERMETKNDISITRKSTWHLTGSENHDLNFKACCLITSQIFMELPDYKDRAYPDLGKGAGSGYWFHYMYKFMGGDENDFGPEGRANESDGKKYTAQEHYEAWVKFLKEYFRERAKRGFFLEAGATGYMKWTLSFISLIMEFCKDEELRSMAKSFCDLIWCEWAQDEICGRRGGAKTRFVFEDRHIENDSMYHMARFLMGGECDAGFTYYFQLLADYSLPEIVWDMVINKHEMGSYEYYSRRPGEEEMLYPRPLGNERTMLCAPNSRMVHYSYVTPNYILGTQFDHPYMIHSHLSYASRWNGLILGVSPNSYIFPTAFVEKDSRLCPQGNMYRSVQKKNVLICQRNANYFRINPEWFPGEDVKTEKYGFYLGKEYNIEKLGDWYIIKDSDCYIGLRSAYGESKAENSRIILFSNPAAPAIIHIEEADKFKSSKDFYEYLTNKCKLSVNNTVVPGFYTITYTFENTELYFNCANNEPPRICGELIDYEYPYTFKSPFMESEYGSGRIIVKKGKLTLEFNFN